MNDYKFEIWSKTGGKVSTTTVTAGGYSSAKKLAEAQNPGYVIKGGTRVL